MAVKIVIDSASDISEKEALSLGISMLPMEITFGETTKYLGWKLDGNGVLVLWISAEMLRLLPLLRSLILR